MGMSPRGEIASPWVEVRRAPHVCQGALRFSPKPRSIAGSYGVVREVHVAVGLRPKSDPAGERLRQRVLQIELAIEITFYLRAVHADLEVVPLPCRGRGEERLPFSNFHSTMLFSRQFARTVR